MDVIKYDLRGAYEAGFTSHPQKVTTELGMNILKFQGEPMGDCVFMEVDNIPKELPDFITTSDYKFPF